MHTTEHSEHAEYEIYYKYLRLKQRGTPLWVPGPSRTLPTKYRRIGTSIGDVGIFDLSTGCFNFLFNIFLPADDEINKGRVPRGFMPLDMSKVEKAIHENIVYDRGCCLA